MTDDTKNAPLSGAADDTKKAKGALHPKTADFDQMLEDAGDQPVLVDFYADWCGPCQLAAPVIEKLAMQYSGKAVVAKVNVDEEHGLAERYGVRSIPTVLLFHKKQVKDEQIGYAGEQGYLKMLNKVLTD